MPPEAKKTVTHPFTLYGRVDLVGRSYAYLDCPFCGAQVKVFIWSLAGGGKKCTCGAKHTQSTARGRVSSKVVAESEA